jgi:hypothetical protein
MTVIVSQCGRYRYMYGAGVAPFCAFVLLNPSTAGVEAPDDATTPTVRRNTRSTCAPTRRSDLGRV